VTTLRSATLFAVLPPGDRVSTRLSTTVH